MLRPRVYDFYRLSTEVHPLMRLVPLMKLRGEVNTIQLITIAKLRLLLFLGDDFVDNALPHSKAAAQRLSDRIDQQFLTLGKPFPEFLEQGTVDGLLKDLRRLENLLEAELGSLPITCCDDKELGNLSSQKLLEGAHLGYPVHVRQHLTSFCREEIDEAGRCIIYERPTAAGFHILRSVEITVKQYLTNVPGFVMPPLNRQSWGTYIVCLKEGNADKKVTDALQSIKDNHRNPLMHPEDTLTMHESVSLFSVCQNMIELLIADLQRRKLISI